MREKIMAFDRIGKVIQKRFGLKFQPFMMRWAVLRAFRQFMRCEPRWAASLFDEYFLLGQAAPLLSRYVQTAKLPSANELAQAWVAQFGPLAPKPSALRLSEVKQAATEYLCYLEHELAVVQ